MENLCALMRDVAYNIIVKLRYYGSGLLEVYLLYLRTCYLLVLGICTVFDYKFTMLFRLFCMISLPYLVLHIEIVNTSAVMYCKNLYFTSLCFFQEREEKIRAEVALSHSLLIPSSSAQYSYDNPANFSMDDFEGILCSFAQ